MGAVEAAAAVLLPAPKLKPPNAGVEEVFDVVVLEIAAEPKVEPNFGGSGNFVLLLLLLLAPNANPLGFGGATSAGFEGSIFAAASFAGTIVEGAGVAPNEKVFAGGSSCFFSAGLAKLKPDGVGAADLLPKTKVELTSDFLPSGTSFCAAFRPPAVPKPKAELFSAISGFAGSAAAGVVAPKLNPALEIVAAALPKLNFELDPWKARPAVAFAEVPCEPGFGPSHAAHFIRFDSFRAMHASHSHLLALC